MKTFRVGQTVKSDDNDLFLYRVVEVHLESLTIKTIGGLGTVFRGVDKELFTVVKGKISWK